MAHKLGMDVVAEGVKNGKQLMMLQPGCEQIQGDCFSLPVAPKSALRMIESGVSGGAFWPLARMDCRIARVPVHFRAPWDPSQSGLRALRLQPQKKTAPVLSGV